MCSAHAVGLVHAGLDSDGLLEGALAGGETLDDEQGEDDQAEQRVAAYVENKVARASAGMLALRRPLSAPDHASGCPEFRLA